MDAQLYDNAQKMLRVLDEGGIDVIREMGIKGRPSEDDACLVAVYLNQTVGGQWSVGSQWTCVIGDDGRGGDNLELPLKVQCLISDFDDGNYPDLEE